MDSAALFLGSQLATKARTLWESLGNRPEVCVKGGFLAMFIAIILVVIMLLLIVFCPPVGALITALAAPMVGAMMTATMAATTSNKIISRRVKPSIRLIMVEHLFRHKMKDGIHEHLKAARSVVFLSQVWTDATSAIAFLVVRNMFAKFIYRVG